MVRWWRAVYLAAAVSGLAACGAPTAPTAAESPSPSMSPSPSCVPYPAFTNPLADRSSLTKEAELDTLVIAAGPPLCTDPDTGTGLVLSMAYIRFGPAGTRATPSGRHELIGLYDGSRELRIPFPILGSPCLGAAVYLGEGDIGDRQLPVTDPAGVRDGPRLYGTNLLGATSIKSVGPLGLLAVDATSGDKCVGDSDLDLRPAK